MYAKVVFNVIEAGSRRMIMEVLQVIYWGTKPLFGGKLCILFTRCVRNIRK